MVANTLRDQLPRCVEDSPVVATLSLPSTWVHYQTTGVGEIAATQSQCDAMFDASIFRSPAHLVHWPVVQGGDTHQVAATPISAAMAIAKAVADVGYEVESILPPGAALLHASTMTAIKISSILTLDPVGGLISAVNEDARQTMGSVLCGLCRPLPACELESGSSLHVGQLESWLVSVAAEYAATCRYAGRMGDPCDASLPVLICGQLAAVEGVDRLLASLIERPVAVWRYAGRIRPGMGSEEIDRRNANGNFTRQQWDADTTEALSVSLAFCSVGLASDKNGGK
ncbi:hypothetical protein [Rubripirellula lacrimiformis]|uniref:hypothetical protein n=1 Tax=Rubripirellula lacrimiformis TaxID=1930273 RepID=UPI0011A3C912|nr:hypothetical protein [Rubripirellula lacrimiformis]